MRQSALWLVLFSLALALPGHADTNHGHVCHRDDAQRLIQVVYLVPGQAVPCEVHYEKDGEREVLWRANNQEGFCEEQARTFVNQQQEWGWQCEAISTDEEIAPGDGYPE